MTTKLPSPAETLQLYEAHGADKVAGMFGVTRAAVYHRLQSAPGYTPRKFGNTEALTRRVLAFVVEYMLEYGGNSPSFTEIAEQVDGVSSTSVVDYHLKRLERRGIVNLIGYKRSRSIVIRDAIWQPPPAVTKLLEAS